MHEASLEPFRPIIMTTLAALMGAGRMVLLPRALREGMDSWLSKSFLGWGRMELRADRLV